LSTHIAAGRCRDAGAFDAGRMAGRALSLEQAQVVGE